MGNDQPGDGYKYRGRGYIQITGHDNYEVGNALGMDLVNHPELAATPEGATKTALQFWEQNMPAEAREDVRRATHVINKGDMGLREREQHFAEWEDRLTPEVMAGLARGEMLLPISQKTTHGVHAVGHSGNVLRQGDHGEAVTALQTQLGEQGYLRNAQGQPDRADSHFGPHTAAAVQAFQREHHLHDDAVVGPATQQAIQDQSPEHGQPQVVTAVPLNDPAHVDHALFRQAQSRVHQLDAQLGRPPDIQSDNLAGMLTVNARADGIQRIDQVALSTDGQRLWAVQTSPGRTDHLFDLRTSISTDAVHASLKQCSAQWPQAMQQYQALQQAQQATLAPEQTMQQGPPLTR
jgi:putative chitinase